MTQRFPQIFDEAARDDRCILLVLSKAGRRAADAPEKVTLRPVEIRGRRLVQLTEHRLGRQSHTNLETEGAVERVRELFGSVFEHGHLYTAETDYSARMKPGGKERIRTKPASKKPPRNDGHNRTKNYLLPEGTPVPFLVEIGVMNDMGHVRKAMHAKFRQINRFLELVDDVLKDLPADRTLSVVDYGCGKSYLTFALHHLLTVLRGRNVDIVGLDRNADVISDCQQLAEKLNLSGIEFRAEDIAEYSRDESVDLAVSLHACDTATDDAIAQAVRWNASVIFAVPCCQHELAPQLTNNDLSPILRHGILRERLAALATDALRAELLEQLDYSTQVLEFIDMEHTAKNVLLRAVRKMKDQPDREVNLERFRSCRDALGIRQFKLEERLDEFL